MASSQNPKIGDLWYQQTPGSTHVVSEYPYSKGLVHIPSGTCGLGAPTTTKCNKQLKHGDLHGHDSQHAQECRLGYHWGLTKSVTAASIKPSTIHSINLFLPWRTLVELVISCFSVPVVISRFWPHNCRNSQLRPSIDAYPLTPKHVSTNPKLYSTMVKHDWTTGILWHAVTLNMLIICQPITKAVIIRHNLGGLNSSSHARSSATPAP